MRKIYYMLVCLYRNLKTAIHLKKKDITVNRQNVHSEIVELREALYLMECGFEPIKATYIGRGGGIGGGVRAYQLDVRVISKDKLKLLAIKNRLIDLLDCHNRATRIKDNDAHIRKIRLINGGGITKAENGDYYAFLYFYVII